MVFDSSYIHDFHIMHAVYQMKSKHANLTQLMESPSRTGYVIVVLSISLDHSSLHIGHT